MYLLAGLKQGAWLTKMGNYSTDIKTAAVFDREDALAMVKRHRAASNVLVPVRQEDIV